MGGQRNFRNINCRITANYLFIYCWFSFVFFSRNFSGHCHVLPHLPNAVTLSVHQRFVSFPDLLSKEIVCFKEYHVHVVGSNRTKISIEPHYNFDYWPRLGGG